MNRTVDANVGVVLEAEINVLLDAKAKVSRLAKVDALQFVFLDLFVRLDGRRECASAPSIHARESPRPWHRAP